MIKYYKGGHIIHLTDAVLEQHRKTMMKQRTSIDPMKLRWKPCVLALCVVTRPADRQTGFQSCTIGIWVLEVAGTVLACNACPLLLLYRIHESVILSYQLGTRRRRYRRRNRCSLASALFVIRHVAQTKRHFRGVVVAVAAFVRSNPCPQWIGVLRSRYTARRLFESPEVWLFCGAVRRYWSPRDITTPRNPFFFCLFFLLPRHLFNCQFWLELFRMSREFGNSMPIYRGGIHVEFLFGWLIRFIILATGGDPGTTGHSFGLIFIARYTCRVQ